MRKLSHEEIGRQRLRKEEISAIERLPVVACLENVRSLYNVGSIFRTSDAALLEKLILTGFTPSPPRKEIEKTALGATKTVPWEYRRSPADAVDQLRKNGFRICCLELTDQSIPYDSVRPEHFPLCLILGNEITGVSAELITSCDFGIQIPMYGTKHSLNVAVAYGIAIFELSKIWRRHSRSTQT
ncbi:MAG: RNA methyltransferase [Ignavibacteria bacterium]|nr:RNA methyltransferase [Ignavibacteria bacterium]